MVQPSKAEYVSLRKEIYDEIVAKYVPEDILTNVSNQCCACILVLKDVLVHDPDHGDPGRSVANEKAVHAATGSLQLLHIRPVLVL